MVLLAVSPQLAAAETVDAGAQFIKSIDRMMVSLAPQGARASAAIKKAYRSHLNLLVLDEYDALEHALSNGGLVPLPGDSLRFNLKPRVDGRFPIGEKDLDNQSSYISARPATVGAMIEVASRVKSGPLEITSMVRHSEYQNTLKTTNGNANTSIPMHTMGMAFDIALINTPIETIYEIRDVLREMQAAGDILFIGERQQLVFHVVPHPSRLGYFADVYAATMAATTPGANIIPSSPVRDTLRELVPAVTAEVIALRPTADFAEEWWATDNTPSDLTIEVLPDMPPPSTNSSRSLVGKLAAGCAAILTGLFNAARALIA